MSIPPTLEIGSREGVWKAVEQGLGISVVSDFEFVPHPDLRTVEIEDCVIRTEYQIVCLNERTDSQKIQAFIQVAQDMRSDAPPPKRPRPSTPKTKLGL